MDNVSDHVRSAVLGFATLLDLDAIWEYIAIDSTEAADRWIAELESDRTVPPDG
jgi:hypothetical protein